MIAIACDHGGFAYKQTIMQHLADRQIEFRDFGTYTPDSCDYPDFAKPVARAVASGEYDKGILICGTFPERLKRALPSAERESGCPLRPTRSGGSVQQSAVMLFLPALPENTTMQTFSAWEHVLSVRQKRWRLRIFSLIHRFPVMNGTSGAFQRLSQLTR